YTRLSRRTGIAQSRPYGAVIDLSVTKITGGGEHSDAPAATVVERARGCRARRAGGGDVGRGGGRTVYPYSWRARGGPAVCADPAAPWHHRRSDPPQYARWGHQRRALDLGRV